MELAGFAKVYSDHCLAEELTRLRDRLYRKFYSKRQLLRILDKARRSGLLKLFFAQGPSNSARFVHSVLRAWIDVHRR